ncbi:GNAT family N-acetyltransferase [Streptomyces nitrosporeus]|uniref:GNAT family N-acetyltransferase n=1 Tax=Streptomyces nitrosporeus TaxID=28894 RepID=UPI00331C8F1B
MKATVRLEELTPDNVLDACRLEVAPGQEGFVAPVARSIAEAYVHPDVAWPRLICDGDRAVGFVMAFFDIPFAYDRGVPGAPARSGLWRLAVAAGEQGRGYGRFAVTAVNDEIRRRGGTLSTVTWRSGEGGPQEFYLRLGYRWRGLTEDGENLGEMDLAPPGPA